jgi:ABC-type lipoprotein release transport system permease subunit
LLTIMTIALGLTFNILMRGIGDGFHEQMVDNSVRAHMGHLQIHERGYHDDPGLNKDLPHPEEVERVLGEMPNLRGYSLRVLGDGLASTAENSAGVSIVGINPNQERTVTTIDRSIYEGEYLASGMKRPILMGDRLARVLRVEVGEKVVLLVQAADGSMGAEQYRVVGTFRSGSPELDRGVVYLLQHDAQSLFALEGRISEAVVLLNSSRDVPGAQQSLSGALAGRPVEVLSWEEVEPFLKQFIDLDDAFFYIIVLILFVVISVGILNTIMMSVFERVREFGVMMALGMKPRQIVRLVIQEAAFLGLVGIAVGGLLGSATTLAFAASGMDLSGYAEGAAAIGMTSTVVYPKLTTANVVLSNLSVLAVVMLVALYPALRAARLQPVEAIRHV